uniref:Uncharacterized protein n=1 Tax=Caenorhabditis japonica TaxID=281687 RepID=A0A8R1DUG2_CAEJA
WLVPSSSGRDDDAVSLDSCQSAYSPINHRSIHSSANHHRIGGLMEASSAHVPDNYYSVSLVLGYGRRSSYV